MPFQNKSLISCLDKWLLLVGVLLFDFLSLTAQHNNIGIPFTTNYSNQVYKAGTQNWDIAQHPNGFVFFANNNGLLQFDGTNWKTFPLKNKTIARSIHITKAGRIYIGGQGEFGYFEPNEKGELNFHSLLPYIPEVHKNFTGVWEIVEWEEKIYFNASNKIYVFKGEKIEVIERGKIHFIGQAAGRLFFNNEKGLHEILENRIEFISSVLSDKLVTSALDVGSNRLLFSTLQGGFFELKNKKIQAIYPEHLAFWQTNKIYCALTLEDEKIAVGTTNSGLLILDDNGLVLHQLRKQNSLQNNNILSLFKDRTSNLWLGLDNGIDYVAINSPFSIIIPDQEQESTAYNAQIFENTLFLGTSSGLYQQAWKNYYNPLQKNDFRLSTGSAGQVWGMNTVDETLFLGHHEGGFLVKKEGLQKISPAVGNWTALPLAQYPEHYIVGTYEGLQLYKKEKNTWTLLKVFEEFQESCRIMEQDETGIIWVSHPYRGIYKVELADDLNSINVQLYGKEDGFPSNNLNHVFKINSEVVFTGETGIYRYDAVGDQFTPHNELIALVGKDKSVQRFFEDAVGNIWFATAEETGILKIKDKGLKKSFVKVIYPELNRKLVRGFEFIYPYDEYNVFIGAEKGFIHFNPAKSNKQHTHSTVNIVKVQSLHDNKTLLAGQYDQQESAIDSSFSHDNNAFQFNYATPDFQSAQNLLYSTRLEGYDNTWSTWSSKTGKEFTNLSPGNYRFLVKAKSIYEIESTVATFSFSVSPPWYASMQAFLVYTLLIASFLAGLILIPQKRFRAEKTLLKSEQKRQEVAHQEEVARSEQAIGALKNQQLQSEIAYKNQELAISTMHLVQRGELIHQLKEKLDAISKVTADKNTAKELKKVNRLLDNNAQLDNVWNQFAHHFDQVHVDFLRKIKEQYPDLTANDQKLCAYLKMNLSTKEMAPLMNISIRGVEVARYRLRKKLDLDSTVNLNAFMLNFSS